MKKLFDVEEVQQEGRSNEWFTPAKYIEAARAVMGVIDLDPASCELANRTVTTKYYTKEDNGLEQPWYGKIWLNPPYSSTNGTSNIGAFTRRLIAEYQDGKIDQAILLSTTNTSVSWFNLLWDYPICFCDHKVNFDLPVRSKSRFNGKATHMHGTIFVYLGPNHLRFAEVFSEFGPVIPAGVAVRREQPVQQPTLWDEEA